MSKFTPGPWICDKAENSILSQQINGTLKLVGQARSTHYSVSVRDANATLMAAAPELLKDLQEAAATLRKYEALHLAKGTAESDVKAAANAEMAQRFERTIGRATGDKS